MIKPVYKGLFSLLFNTYNCNIRGKQLTAADVSSDFPCSVGMINVWGKQVKTLSVKKKGHSSRAGVFGYIADTGCGEVR